MFVVISIFWRFEGSNQGPNDGNMLVFDKVTKETPEFRLDNEKRHGKLMDLATITQHPNVIKVGLLAPL